MKCEIPECGADLVPTGIVAGRQLYEPCERCALRRKDVEASACNERWVSTRDAAFVEQRLMIPPQYTGACLSELPVPLEMALKDVADLDQGCVGILGPCGTGKTRALRAVQLRAWARKGTDWESTVRYYTAPDLAIRLKAISWNSVSDLGRELSALTRGSGTLLLDDLGSGSTSNEMFGLIAQVIDGRDMWDRAMVVASNLTLAQISDLDDRVASRLSRGKVFTLDGEDYRLKGAK